MRDCKIAKKTIICVMSVPLSACSSQRKNLLPIARIFMKFYDCFPRIRRENSCFINFHKNNEYFTLRHVYINDKSQLIPLGVWNKSDKNIHEIEMHILCSTNFSENHAIYETMWKTLVQPERSQMAIQYGTCDLHAG